MITQISGLGMPYTTLLYERKGRLAYLTLHRPQAQNTIDLEMAYELREVCGRLEEDEEVGMVILTGAGEGAFSLGNDLSQITFPERGLVPADGEGWNPAGMASRAVAAVPWPVIAAIDGLALGGGLELALACDLRIATEEARFGFPETSYGLLPGGGGTQRLPRLVGKGKALEMLLTADPIDAWEAYRVGLVNRVVPRGHLLGAAQEMAQRILSRGPIAIRYAKEALNKGLDLTLEQGLRLEADLNVILQTTRDREEGVRAFLEKRAAHFEKR